MKLSFVLVAGALALGTSACGSSIPEELYTDFPPLDVACPDRLECGETVPCEGTRVTVQGHMSFQDSYQPGVSSAESSKAIILRAKPDDLATALVVNVDNEAKADETFQKIWDTFDGKATFSKRISVTGEINGTDMPTNFTCSRGIFLVVRAPEDISVE